MLTDVQELAMHDAVARQGTAMPGGQPPGMVLVAAIVSHKDGPPPKGPDTRTRYLPGQQYWMEEGRALRNEKAGLIYRVGSCSLDWWQSTGRVLSPWPEQEEPLVTAPQPGSLRIMSGCGYDPGSQAYRFHSALNRCTKHASAFVRWGDSNPHSSFRQLDAEQHAAKVRQGVLDADVLHCHVAYYLLNNTGLSRRPGQLLIRHYHGSLPGGSSTHVQADMDEALGAKLVGARLSFYRDAALASARLGYQVRIEWLPITVPVARYAALRNADRLSRTPTAAAPFLIAHAPTKREWKGTGHLAKAVRALQAKGLPVKVIMIEGLPQRQALERKAECDATFDSFWLGLQTSGLEGAAMSQPVIAGDADVRALHEQHVGYCPYTFADTEAALTEQIERLVVDVDYRVAEAERVRRFCIEYHDYPAVARRYESLLAGWLGRADVFTEPVKEVAA